MDTASPNDKTTLLLNNAWQPITVITARASFMHLLRGRVSCLDKNLQIFHSLGTWNEMAEFYGDQPTMRSAKQVWPIPTIVVVTSKFFRKPKKKKLSLYDLYRLCEGKCQYCFKKFPIKDLTIDHVFPKSKGGQDVHENRVLACRHCNSIKGSIYPYYNVNGDPVKPIQIPDFFLSAKKLRNEWKNFISGV